jgi:cell wall-associated NlpC family hydrolase
VPAERPFSGVAAPLLALVGVAAGVLTSGAVVLAGVAGMVTLDSGGSSPSTAAAGAIPPPVLTLYEQAAGTCPGLSWAVLAAIGTVESGNGTSNLPGVHSGANAAGAEGPMQFEPATFAAYDMPVPPGGASPPNPYDPTDAVYAAARYLCANGAGSGATLTAAVFAYNHSQAYVNEVLKLAETYIQPPAHTVSAGPVRTVAVEWAIAQIGTPYIWGGETPGVGFDCSGLVQAAYKMAGIALPRVAQDQFDAGPQLPAGVPPAPGDLVFFGGGTADVEHVGLVVAPDVMVDAPFTGADVREDRFPSTVGGAFGSQIFVGATRPGG